MSAEYLASVVWQRITMHERERRDYEQDTGQIAAGWSRDLDHALRSSRDDLSRPMTPNAASFPSYDPKRCARRCYTSSPRPRHVATMIPGPIADNRQT